ncbi:MAG: hypothetical protein P1U34_01030 [Coxiellaceae bacterium]|nr:hypothetical protein [Coxiellaceae bacterium]
MSRDVVVIDFDRLQAAIAKADYADFKNEIDPKFMLFITLQQGGVTAFTAKMTGFKTDAGLSLLDLALKNYFSTAESSANKTPLAKMIKQLHESFKVPYQALPSDKQRELDSLSSPAASEPTAATPRPPLRADAGILAKVGIAGRYNRRANTPVLPASAADHTSPKKP